MATLLHSSWLLFRLHLALILRSRRALLCALLATLPPFLAWLVLRFGPPIKAEQLGGYLAWFLSLQVIVPILALVAGSAVLTEEIESRTITFVFTRPIPRAALLYGRWLATVVLVCGLLGASAYMTTRVALEGAPAEEARLRDGSSFYEGHRNGDWAKRHRALDEKRFELESALSPQERDRLLAETLDRFLWAAMLGGLVYTSLFAVLGVFYRHPMILGLGYAFAFEGIMANLPGESQALSIQYYLRCLFVDERLFVFHRLYRWDLSEFGAAAPAARLLLVLTGIVLALGGYAIQRRQYVLTA